MKKIFVNIHFILTFILKILILLRNKYKYLQFFSRTDVTLQNVYRISIDLQHKIV